MKTRFPITALIIASIVLAVVSCTKTDIKLKDRMPYLPTTPYQYVDTATHVSNNPWGGNFTSNNAPSFNATTNTGAALGRVLFYERAISINNSISCGTCHKQELAFADNVPFSQGYANKLTARNSMSVVNESMNSSFFFDGRVPSLEDQTIMPVQNHIEMGMEKIDQLPNKLKTLSYYPKLFKDAFGSEEITKEKIAFALAQFMRSMVSRQSKFDIAANQQNNFALLTNLENDGKDAFNKFKCASCHNGNNFNSDGNGFANIGLDMVYTDKGLSNVTGNATDDGKFRIPTLRNIALTAPYMHDGRYATLEQVVNHYSDDIKINDNLDSRLTDGGWGISFTGDPIGGGLIAQNSPGKATTSFMKMTDYQKKALVAFLKTLTDENYIKDVRFSDPFR